ncbi:MAG: hypothetical protein HY731_05455 [Candidatus Tectomicrobia bacterium]|nr:hypothetical protein [Candidatus Tectomicrobia bacterium]
MNYRGPQRPTLLPDEPGRSPGGAASDSADGSGLGDVPSEPARLDRRPLASASDTGVTRSRSLLDSDGAATRPGVATGVAVAETLTGDGRVASSAQSGSPAHWSSEAGRRDRHTRRAHTPV